METPQDFLHVLGLDEGADRRTIRHAYARRLKLIDQARETEAFQELRTAYEAALAWAEGDKEEDAAASSPAGASPVPELPAQEQEPAAALFSGLELFAAGRRRDDPDAWREELYRCLDDERLVHLGARFAFEERVVRHLGRGWQPGNEALFVAAIEAFAWDGERRGLEGFGADGVLLSQAIDERICFDRQAIGLRGLQGKLVMRLRWEEVPDAAELRYNASEFHTLAWCFPALMHVTVGSHHIARWQRAYQELPPEPERSENKLLVEILPQLVALVLVLLVILIKF